MSKISFRVRTVRNIATSTGPALTKEAGAAGALMLQLPPGGSCHIVIEFSQSYRIKNFIFKNSGSAFVGVMGGTSADYETLRTAENPMAHLPNLTQLVADTQLCSWAQYNIPANHNPANNGSPLMKVKMLQPSRLNRYVSNGSFKFLLLELKAFHDAEFSKVGVGWIEIYGEPAAESTSDDSALVAATLASSAVTTNAALNSKEYQRDAEGDATMITPRGAAAFKPTGAAEKALAHDLKMNPPVMKKESSKEQAAKPILNRNETFIQGLRDASAAPAAAPPSGGNKPPSCPNHPGQHSFLQRQDRRTDPPKIYYVCTAKDASGKSCDQKIYVD